MEAAEFETYFLFNQIAITLIKQYLQIVPNYDDGHKFPVKVDYIQSNSELKLFTTVSFELTKFFNK